MTQSFKLSQSARYLSFAGLLPQIICIALVASGNYWQSVALAAAWAYAAIIFSFLGGIWWGLGIGHPALDRRIFAIAVLPSLIALVSFLPWNFGWTWPGPSLAVLGICLCVSPLVDRWIAGQVAMPAGWLQLRIQMSLGLGGMSLILSVLA
jgi:Protein of unknown function (DUF3429)